VFGQDAADQRADGPAVEFMLDAPPDDRGAEHRTGQ